MARPAVIKYRNTLVSFFDILGFKEIVKKQSPHAIASNVALFQKTGAISNDTSRAFEAQSFQFSDSIVRMMPLDSEANTKYPVGLLFHEILTIVHACLEMAARGVPLRGGITVGDAYFSGSMMFGPAMVRAYELESRVAVYPRIVVDPAVIEGLKRDPLLKKDTHSVSDELSELRQLLWQDADGLWFVDFLYAARREVDGPEQYPELLDSNKTHLEAVLNGREVLDDIAVKALWSAHYHNQVLDRLVGDGGSAKEVDRHRISIPTRLLGSLVP